MLPMEDSYPPGATTLFDLLALESLEMTISHTPVTGKFHYHLQAWNLTRYPCPTHLPRGPWKPPQRSKNFEQL